MAKDACVLPGDTEANREFPARFVARDVVHPRLALAEGGQILRPSR